MECSFCTKPPIMISGKKYCDTHIGNFETIFFEQAVVKEFSSAHEMLEFFEWAFGSQSPKLSDLQKWHERIPRLEKKCADWRSHGIYEESQDHYIRKIVKEYRKEVEK